jgi:DNA-binding transcriptional MerR regulator
MPTKLPDSLRLSVIQQWLAGHQRDKIAFDNGISAGAVTNIVNEWRMRVGSYAADELRDLGVTLRRIGISHAQCAVGFRIATMLRRFGVQEDKFESFVSYIHNRCCNELGLTPERIGFYIANLAELSHTVPISQIPNYISQKVEEKKRIEEQIQELECKMKELQTKKSNLEQDTTSAVESHAITQEKLNWYSKIKEELEEKYGIPAHDISKLGVMVNNVGYLFGYDAQKVVDALSNLQSLKSECEHYQTQIQEASYQSYSLNRERSRLQEDVDSCNQTLVVYGQLYGMGLGLKQLKQLWHTIVEIAHANNIPK